MDKKTINAILIDPEFKRPLLIAVGRRWYNQGGHRIVWEVACDAVADGHTDRADLLREIIYRAKPY